jgi:hypothetical protein
VKNYWGLLKGGNGVIKEYNFKTELQIQCLTVIQ